MSFNLSAVSRVESLVACLPVTFPISAGLSGPEALRVPRVAEVLGNRFNSSLDVSSLPGPCDPAVVVPPLVCF